MIDIYFKSVRDETFEKIKEFKHGSWIHIYDASLDDLYKIESLINLDFEHLRDCLDKYEIPRIEQSNNTISIFTRHPSEEELGLYTVTLTIILTDSYVVTICPQKSHVINKILIGSLQLTTTQKSKLLLNILLKITQDYTNNIKRVRYTVLEQEKKMVNIDSDAIILLTKNEEILNQFLTSLVPMRNLLEAILSGRFVKLYEKDYDILQDLSIAIKQSEDLCRVNVKSIRSLRDSYQIIFTNDVNKTIKRLTAITIIFTIPTIIASVYGMNVELPFEKNPLAFVIIINIVIILSFLSVLVFIKKKWL
jgi:magnesium transporter